uniref:LRRCT domain-containing protein n=1 Tax=Parastrongyloides trichosuri TaxID=131310 RepID=A0A0N5A2G2_PARTI
MKVTTFIKFTFILIFIIKISNTLQGKNKCKYIDYHIKRITEKDDERACKCYSNPRIFMHPSTADKTYGFSDWVGCTRKSVPSIYKSLTSINETVKANIYIYNAAMSVLPRGIFDKVKPSALAIEDSNLSLIRPFSISTVGSQLKSLILRRNIIKSFEPNVFDNITELEYLDISYNKISSLKKGIIPTFEKLETLYIVKNDINFIENGFFEGFKNLKKLNLAKNKLEIINSSTFKGLENLEHLNLEGNEIQFIEKDAFLGLKKLQFLNLGNNNIFQLYLSDLPNLQKVHLFYNAIDNLTELIFDNLKSLKYLNMDNNPIARINNTDLETLAGSPDMEFLSFAHSKIEIIEPKAFENVKNLKILSMMDNDIIEIGNDKSFLKPLTKLTTLILSSNRIETIERNDLKGLKDIKILNLENNMIVNISSGALDSITTLENLYLNGNRLYYLPDNLFDSFDKSKLKNVDLSDNPWEAICGKSWISRWLEEIGDANRPTGDLNSLTTKCGTVAFYENDNDPIYITIIATILAVLCLISLLTIAYFYFEDSRHTFRLHHSLKQFPAELLRKITNFSNNYNNYKNDNSMNKNIINTTNESKSVLRPLSTIYETESLLDETNDKNKCNTETTNGDLTNKKRVRFDGV